MADHSFISPQSTTIAPASVKDVISAQEQFQNEPDLQLLQKPSIQFKLSIGAVDDPLEHEADAMADSIMRMSEQNFIQRKCSHCEGEEKLQRKPLASFIQRKVSSSGAVASDAISSQINASKGNGSSMDSNTQTFMQTRFGTNFSEIKIHTNNESVQMNSELHAKAFTVGNDIYFNEGQYNPSSIDGKHLLAHELTHTIQQGKQLQAKIIQRDDAVSEHRAGGFTFSNPLKKDEFTDTSLDTSIGVYNYWYQKIKSVYEEFQFTVYTSPPLTMNKDAWDIILAKGWELRPSMDPTATNNITSKHSVMLPVLLGANISTTGKQYRAFCFYSYSFDKLKGKPVFGLTLRDFFPEPTSIVNINETPTVTEKKVPKNIFDRLNTASNAGFPGTSLTQYFTAHPEVKTSLAGYVEWRFREYKDSQNKADLSKTEFAKVKENNGGIESIILLQLIINASRDAGVYNLDLKYSSDNNNSLTADHNKKDYADFQIEKDEKAHPGAVNKFGGVRGLDTITDPIERTLIKNQAVNFYTSEIDKSGVKERRFIDVEIDQVFPLSGNPADPTKTEFFYYTFIIHKPDVNNLIYIDVKRIGKKGDAVVGDPIKTLITRVPGYAENAFDAGKGETPDKLIKWILARYKGVTETEIKAATVADINTKINAIIQAKSGTTDWFKTNYSINILNAADGKTRLKDIHKVADGNLVGIKDYTVADLNALELSLQKFGLPVLKQLKNIFMVRQEKNVPNPDKLSGLTQRTGYTYDISTKVINAGTLKRTVIIYDLAMKADDTSFIGGSAGVNSTNVDTITHELGHIVAYTIPGMKHGVQSYLDHFNKFYTALTLTPVTAYAKDNTDPSHSTDTEYFPEAFMLFMNDPEWLLTNQYQTYFWFLYLQQTGAAPSLDQAKSIISLWEKQKVAGGASLAEAIIIYSLWKEYAVQKSKFPDATNMDTVVLIISEFQTIKQRPIRQDEIKAIVTKWQAFVIKMKNQPTNEETRTFFM